METTVEGLCNAMARCQFLQAEQIRDLRQRWQNEAGQASGNFERFTAWLAARQIATEYQIGVLSRGNGQQLFLGPYRILERIGRGRMAGVYKATHDSGLTVAVKVLPPSKAAKRETLARFQREVKLALSVKHPNVVRTFHAGEHKGLHYLTMEYLEGETLEEVLQQRKKLPVGEAVRLVHQALLGLEAIHEQKLVHRDLKPANLMLVGSQQGSAAGAVVKILDLGMGRALFDDEDGPPQFDLTRPGEMLGSADCMSPEQAKDAHNIDIRSDIYSLGCVLYHTLAGEPPFADVSNVRQLLRHATEQPKPITERNPEVPGGIQQVLDWMLAKDPAKRYPTPARAAQALEIFLAVNNEPVPRSDARLAAYLKWIDSFDSSGEALAPLSGQPAIPPLPVAVHEITMAVDFEMIREVAPEAVIPAINAHEIIDKTVPIPPNRPRSDDLMDQKTLDMPSPIALPREPKGPPPPPARRRNEREEEVEPVRDRKRAPRERDEEPRRRRGYREDEEEPARIRRRDRSEDEEEEPARVMGMRPRELLVLTICLLTIFAMGVLGLLVWLLYRILG
jgi:serine/threonine protein kinase